MSPDVPPSSEPNSRLSLESLEEKLRTLPLAEVPDSLASKLLAAVPPVAAVRDPGSGLPRRWPWIVAIVVTGITASVVVYSLMTPSGSKPPNASNENRNAATTENLAPKTSKAVQSYEEAVRFDPYNADAWFGLAKAQAAVGRSV